MQMHALKKIKNFVNKFCTVSFEDMYMHYSCAWVMRGLDSIQQILGH